MVFLVPFDGSDLSKAALKRAKEFATDEEIVALTVIPSGTKYARKKGWSDPREDFEELRETLEAEVHDIASGATFEFMRTESRPPTAKVAKIIRRKARSHDASVVFLGSANAGKKMSPVASVGPGVASDESYDVYIARAN